MYLKNIIRFILIILISFYLNDSFGQQVDTRFYKNQLLKLNRDQERLPVLYKIASTEMQADSILKYADKGLTIANSNKDLNYRVKFKLELGRANIFNDNWNKALHLLNEIEQLARGQDSLLAYHRHRLGTYYLLKGEASQSINPLEEGLELDAGPMIKGKIYRALSQAYYSMGKFDEAIQNGLESEKLFKSINNPVLLENIYRHLGKVFNINNQLDLSISYLYKAIELTEPKSVQRARIYSELGATYIGINDLKLAKESLEIALSILEDLDDETALLEVSLRLSIAEAELKNYDRSEQLLNNSLRYANNIDSYFYKCFITYQQGCLFQKRGDSKLALEYWKKALNMYQSIGNDRMIAAINNEIGSALRKKNSLKESINYLTIAENIAQRNNYVSILQNAQSELARSYEDDKNYEMALRYHKIAQKTADSLSTLKNKEIVQDLKLKYESEKQELKIKELADMNALKERQLSESKKNNILTLSIILLTVALILTCLEFYRRHKNLKRETAFKVKENNFKTKTLIIENLSHEIKTPISVINGYMYLIKKNTVSPMKVLKFSKLAEQSSKAVIKNLDDFLTLLKDENNLKQEPVLETDFLEKRIRNNVSSFTGFAVVKSQRLFYRTNIAPALEKKFAYNDLEKIINNLITNSLKYSPSYKSIYVTSLIKDNQLQIIVKDEGAGIPEGDKKNIYDRFFQSTKHKATGGFGIGLALVKHLCDKYDGRIEFESEEGHGTQFTVALPLLLENPAVHTLEKLVDYEELTDGVINNVPSDDNLPKVLIVDDNVEMVNYLNELLAPTFNCTNAFDGDEALSLSLKNDYNLIISDYKMPKMDGLEFKRALDQSAKNKTTPFILLTANSFENLIDLKLDLGINDFIPKPFGENEIMTRIKNLIENKLYQNNAIQDKEEKIEYNTHVNEFMEKVNVIITKNISDSNFSVGDLAAECGYSQKQLGQIIKDKTGLTVVKLILEVKLLKAYELIAQQKYPTIMDVIFAVGLNNRSYFNKRFLERFGVKPNDLMKK